MSLESTKKVFLRGIKRLGSTAIFDQRMTIAISEVDGRCNFRQNPLIADFSDDDENLLLFAELDNYRFRLYDPDEEGFDGWQGWECEASFWGVIMTVAKRLQLPILGELSAFQLGMIISKQFAKGRYGPALAIHDGLLNIQSGKPFKPGKPSLKKLHVLSAFYSLEMDGVKPSQTEVIRHLAENGIPVTRHFVSRILSKPHFQGQTSDSRKNASPAGMRRLKNAHVAKDGDSEATY